MIKFILNGSFRSGTTVLWKIMRESNSDMVVFCEPLHHELFLSIHRENNLQQYGHGYSTTSEYLSQGNEFLKHLRCYHPLIGKDVYTFNVDSVVQYLKIFESLDKPVILQPNRMHFILSDISKKFNCKVAHIIRHPLDVFNSVMFSSPKLKNLKKATKINPYFLRLLKNSNPYFLHEQCEFISRYLGIETTQGALINKYLHPKRYYLEKFILAWSISNWHAVTEVDSVNGLIIRYEDCMAGDALKVLVNYSSIDIDTTKVKLHRRSIRRHSHKDLNFCYQLSEKLGIIDKFRYLVERFNYA